MFAGLSAWPPLNVIMLFVMYTFLGVSDTVSFLPNFMFGFLCLYYMYLLSCTYLGKKKYGWYATFLLAVNVVFILNLRTMLLELGVTFFSIAALYHTHKFRKSFNKKDLYMLGAILGLGLLYKYQFIIIFFPLLYVFIIKRKDIISYGLKHKKHLLIFILIIFFLTSFFRLRLLDMTFQCCVNDLRWALEENHSMWIPS